MLYPGLGQDQGKGRVECLWRARAGFKGSKMAVSNPGQLLVGRRGEMPASPPSQNSCSEPEATPAGEVEGQDLPEKLVYNVSHVTDQAGHHVEFPSANTQ